MESVRNICLPDTIETEAKDDYSNLQQSLQRRLDTETDMLLHIGGIIRDAKRLNDSGDFSRSLTSLNFASNLVQGSLDRSVNDLPFGIAAKELICRLALLQLQAVNGLIEKGAPPAARIETPVARVQQDHVLIMLEEWMEYPVVSDLECGQAHMEWGKIFRILGQHAPATEIQVYTGDVEMDDVDSDSDTASDSSSDSESDIEWGEVFMPPKMAPKLFEEAAR
jgi:hypothetical protein